MNCYICGLEYTQLTPITSPPIKGQRRIYWKVCGTCLNKIVCFAFPTSLPQVMKAWHVTKKVS